jgi:3-oxoacyl-[acyl-carrier protein] reductase
LAPDGRRRPEEDLTDLGLERRVALVTGGSRGLGLAAARSLAGEGCAVAVAARGAEGVSAAVAGLEALGVRAHGIVADMSEAGAPARAVGEAEAALGPVDVLVANAGGPPPGGFVDVDEAGWDLALRQTLMGTVRLIRAGLPGMRRRGFGRVVTITSASAREPIDGLVLSNAARAGVAAAVRTLAREVAGEGVTVNNVMPGPILTDRQRELLGAAGDLEAALAERAWRNPAGRLGAPEEVGDLVAFLASARAAFITGVSIFIDGGEARAAA